MMMLMMIQERLILLFLLIAALFVAPIIATHASDHQQRSAANKPRKLQPTVTSTYVFDEGNPYHASSRLLDGGAEMLENSNFTGEDPAMQLRQDLLQNYDTGDYPWNWAWNQSDNPDGLREGLPVEIGINFHKVFSVNVEKSLVDLVVWFRLSWKDPRLAWNPEDYGNMTKTWFFVKDGVGASGETSEIWTPDIELWNLEHSLQDTLTDTNAGVTSDGTVFWSRPGHLRAVCKFAGLDDFPFDSLQCRLELGSWVYSGLYVRPIFMGDTGFTIGGSETAGEAFAEFSLGEVTSERFVYPPFPSAPEEDWPVIFYDVTFSRAWQPYARGYLIIQIVLNLIGFCCFWIPPHVGERMSLGITSLLASVASELVVANTLPQTSEVTWFAEFTMGSTLFAAVVLFQSIFVIYFTYHVGNDLTPHWLKKIIRYCSGQDYWPNDNAEEGEDELSTDEQEHGEADPVFTPAASRDSDWSREDTGEHTTKNSGSEPKTTRPRPILKDESADQEKRASSVEFQLPNDDDEPSRVDAPKRTSRGFRNRFSMMSTPSHPHFTSSTRKGFKTVLGRDPDDFRNVKEMVNNYKWQQIAQSIDSFSRVFFPLAYGIFLLIMFTTGAYRS